MLPDVTILADYLLTQMTRIVEGITVRADRMLDNLNLSGGLVYSGKVLLALVEGGLSRDHAYDVVQKHALAATKDRSLSFRERLQSDPEVKAAIPSDVFDTLFDYRPYLAEVDDLYRRIGLLEEGV